MSPRGFTGYIQPSTCFNRGTNQCVKLVLPVSDLYSPFWKILVKWNHHNTQWNRCAGWRLLATFKGSDPLLLQWMDWLCVCVRWRHGTAHLSLHVPLTHTQQPSTIIEVNVPSNYYWRCRNKIHWKSMDFGIFGISTRFIVVSMPQIN